MLIRNKVAIVVVGVGIGVASVYETATSDAMVSSLLRTLIAKSVRAPCRFESASFTFLHGLDVRGLVILDPTAPLGTPLVAARQAEVDYKGDLLGMGPRITRVDIDAPRLRIERKPDGTLPITVAFAKPPEGGPSPRPFVVSARHGEATFVDSKIVVGEPLALRDIAIDVTPASSSMNWTGGSVVLTATSDLLGQVKAMAVLGAAGDPDAVTLDLPSIRIDPTLPGRFVGDLARTVERMAPSGDAAAHVELRFEKDKVIAKEATVEIRGFAARVALPTAPADSPSPKPFDVTEANGRLRFAAGRLEAKDVAFRALGAEFHAQGTVDGVTGPTRSLDTKIEFRRLPATREFREFLPFAGRRVADALDLTATIDATASVSGPADAPTIAVDASFDHGHASYVGYVQPDGSRLGFPWDGNDVSGKVSFRDEVLHIDAAGRHGPASIHVNGTVTMRPGAPDVSEIQIVVKDVPLDDDVRRGFGDERAKRSFDPYKPSGTAAQVAVHVFRDVAVDDHDVAEVVVECDGRAEFLPDVLPEPLHGVSGKIEVLYPVIHGRREEVVQLHGIKASADGFDLTLDGRVQGPVEDLQLELDVAEAGSGLRRAIANSPKVPQGAKDAAKRLGATGPLSASAHMVQSADGGRDDRVAFTLKGTSFQGWGDIPLAARDVTGHVEVAGDVVTFEGIAGEFVMDPFFPRFTGHGRLFDINAKPQPQIHVDAVDLPLADPLRAALGPLAETARAFWDHARPVGAARADCALDFRPDADPTRFEATLSRIRGGIRPLGLELDADDGTCHYDGRRVEVRGLDCAIGAATLRFDEANYDVETRNIDMHVAARGLRFPEELEGPLSRETIDKIVEFAPARTLHAPDVRLAYEPATSNLTIVGAVHLRPRKGRPPADPGYAPEGALDCEPLVFSMPEGKDVGFTGAGRVDDFAIRVGLLVDKFNGPVDFSGTFGTPSTFDMSAHDASFRVAEYPLEHADAVVKLSADGTRVNVKTAKFMNGDFTARVEQGPEHLGYSGDFHIAGADLERFLRFKGASQKDVATGRVDANVDFHDATGARSDLRGDGKITVHDGRLMSAPGLGAVLLRIATAGIYAPSLTDASMKFDLDGESILVKELDVGDSSADTITDGTGRVGFDGTLDVSVDTRLVSLSVPIVGPALNWLQKTLPTLIRVTGTLRNPRTQWAGYSLRRSEGSGRREPQPADEERPPERDPW